MDARGVYFGGGPAGLPVDKVSRARTCLMSRVDRRRQAALPMCGPAACAPPPMVEWRTYSAAVRAYRDVQRDLHRAGCLTSSPSSRLESRGSGAGWLHPEAVAVLADVLASRLASAAPYGLPCGLVGTTPPPPSFRLPPAWPQAPHRPLDPPAAETAPGPAHQVRPCELCSRCPSA